MRSHWIANATNWRSSSGPLAMWSCTPAPASVRRLVFRIFGTFRMRFLILHHLLNAMSCVSSTHSGPKGVWTLERKGERPTTDISFAAAAPTKTHMALKALVAAGHVAYIISQNIDGLHLKSGLARRHIAELHGNMFVETCSKCRRLFVRSTPVPTVGRKATGAHCAGSAMRRACRSGALHDTILDWEHDLPDSDLELASAHSALADVNICLGSTLQINPSGQLALRNRKYGGKVVICNLQPTKLDAKADLRISGYVDEVMERVMKRLGVEIPEYTGDDDRTKVATAMDLDWTIAGEQVKETEKLYDEMVKGRKKVTPTAAIVSETVSKKMKKEPNVEVEPTSIKKMKEEPKEERN